MKLVPMRFMGYTWHHNPKKLTIKSNKKVIELKLPYHDDVLQNFGESQLRINGSGELYGEDCMEQYERLFKLYRSGKEGILCLPRLSPLYACFESLEIVADDTPDVLTYSFSFISTKPLLTNCRINKEADVAQGDTLWDISYRYGVPMDILCVLNPQIMFVNDLCGIEKVRLC